MSSRPKTLLLTTLDERIRLPLTRWLRVSRRVGAIHRVRLSERDWTELSQQTGDGPAGARIKALVRLYAPDLIAVLGHERDGDETARAAVDQIAQTIRELKVEAGVAGFFMTASWATGVVDLGPAPPRRLPDPPRVAEAGRHRFTPARLVDESTRSGWRPWSPSAAGRLEEPALRS